jgi:arsenate reductase (thioredoxin)
MNAKIFNILILCSGNSARSIMAEALFNTYGHGRIQAYSAGSNPKGSVHPLAIEEIHHLNYPQQQLRSKSWDEFATADAPHMDFIITVCDNAAGEPCPVWPGHPITAHWGFSDPAAVSASEEAQRNAFNHAFLQISQRVRLFCDLPLDALDHIALKQELDNLSALQS